jgi:D-lactate dehydrogenase (cytochrome)
MKFNNFRKLLIESLSRKWNNTTFLLSTRHILFTASAFGLVFAKVSFSDYDNVKRSLVQSDENEIRSVTLKIFISELEKVLRIDQIETDINECQQRGKPWSSYHSLLTSPDVIVYPESTDDVSRIVSLCAKHKIAVIPFGGGTSVEGQTLAPTGGVSLDMARMKKILQFNEEDLDITVQAGLGYIELNEFISSQCLSGGSDPLWFPLDPGPGATIGGMCACRCSGSTAVRYGSMRENVLSLTAVLPDGAVVRTGGRARKSSAGYDTARLLVGSEGTLAVITEATLKLHPVPRVSAALRVTFPEGGLVAAARTAKATLNCGVVVGRCELLDDEMIKIINFTNPSIDDWPEYTTLMYEITGINC